MGWEMRMMSGKKLSCDLRDGGSSGEGGGEGVCCQNDDDDDDKVERAVGWDAFGWRFCQKVGGN